jgi:ABC-type uncharacterized transport system involved in gliding motility auxiliary subunit
VGAAVSPAWRRGLATLAGTAGCAVALVFAQLLVARPGWRLDLSPEQHFVLSAHARQILAALDRPVEIIGFLRADDPRNREIEDLLARVRAASPQISTRQVDVNRNPALAREYGVDVYGAVVVASDGRRRDFTNPTEQTLMAAIIQVTHPARRRVYFSAGHGERRVGERDRQSGYSTANVALINELYEVGEIALDGQTPVPDDAAALVVAAPRRDLPPGTLHQIEAFLHRGGGVLVLLEPGKDDAPSLAALLRRYGIAVSDEVVLDGEQRMFAGDYLTMLVPGRSAAHPVSAALTSTPLMSGVRAVRTVPTDVVEDGIDLLATAPESWRTPDLTVIERGAGDFVAGRDTRGPVPVGASVSVRNDGGKPGRLLVYGDADFASNLLLEYLGNRDLLLNSVNWLAGEETMLGTRPPTQAPGVNQLFISASQGERVFWLGTVVLPATILVLGLSGVALRQRRG